MCFWYSAGIHLKIGRAELCDAWLEQGWENILRLR